MMETSTLEKAAQTSVSRRRFFGIAGALAGAGLIASATGCKKTDDPALDLGGGDTQILNYFYVMEQLQAAFYTQAVLQPFFGMTQRENDYFTDIRNHEIAHREYFKNVLAGAAISPLEFDFSTIDFQKRSSVIDTAVNFEDLGIAAINGAAYFLVNADYITAAAKICSVEGRHAAAVRDIRLSGTFADSTAVDSYTGFDGSRSPWEVLSIITPFVKTKFNLTDLPG